MDVNGITIPDESSQQQFITDSIGGYIYEVNTTVNVKQHRLDTFKAHIEDLKSQIVELQATVAELEPQVDEAIDIKK